MDFQGCTYSQDTRPLAKSPKSSQGLQGLLLCPGQHSGLLGAATPHSDSTGRTPRLWSLKPEVEPLHTSWTWLPLEPTCTPGLVWPSEAFPHFLEVSMASIFLTCLAYPSGASKALLHVPAGEPGYFSRLQRNPGTWRTPCPLCLLLSSCLPPFPSVDSSVRLCDRERTEWLSEGEHLQRNVLPLDIAFHSTRGPCPSRQPSGKLHPSLTPTGPLHSNLGVLEASFPLQASIKVFS